MEAKSSRSRSSDAPFSMEDFEKALENFDYEFQKGQVVRGKVVSYETSGAFIDIGAKSPAFLPTEEASLRGLVDVSAIVPLDEEREFLIVRDQDADGQLTLSLRQFELRKAWDAITDMQANNQSLQVRVTGSNKGGVTVDARGLRGFIPRSHLNERDDLDALKGTTLTVTVLELNQERGKLVFSNRLAARSAAISQLEVGQLVEGKVASLKPFGAFVDIAGTTGLLHINQISKNYVESLPALLKVGQPIKALVADLDESRGRISLSTKVLETFPGEMLENMEGVMQVAEERLEKARKALMGE